MGSILVGPPRNCSLEDGKLGYLSIGSAPISRGCPLFHQQKLCTSFWRSWLGTSMSANISGWETDGLYHRGSLPRFPWATLPASAHQGNITDGTNGIQLKSSPSYSSGPLIATLNFLSLLNTCTQKSNNVFNDIQACAWPLLLKGPWTLEM